MAVRSPLALYEHCPRRYWYAHVARIDPPDMHPPDSIEHFLAARLHEALAHFHDEHRRGVVLTLPNLRRYFTRRWHAAWAAAAIDADEPRWRGVGAECLAEHYRDRQPFSRTTVPASDLASPLDADDHAELMRRLLGAEASRYPTRPGPLCAFCEFRRTCPDGGGDPAEGGG